VRVEELTAGQEARIAPDGSIYRAEHPDIGRVVAWSRQRRLKFDDVSLEEMAREFNRYHHVQVRLEGIRAGSHHYSALFDEGDPGTLVRFLKQERDLLVEQVGNEIVIRPRPATDGAPNDE
jgi:ferric-dicitrate binding protein FerR (iron transport regulator)